jgi:hypothetical protein
MSAVQTAPLVITRPINTHLGAGSEYMSPGSQIEILLELDGTTSNAYSTWDDAFPPAGTTIADFLSSAGHLVDVIAYSQTHAIDLTFDESMSPFNATPTWYRVATYRLTPTVPQAVRGQRISGSFLRIRFTNTDALAAGVLTWQARVRSS